MTRLIVYVTEKEFDTLRHMAAREFRGLRDQARYLIIKGLAAEIVDAPSGDRLQPEPAETVKESGALPAVAEEVAHATA